METRDAVVRFECFPPGLVRVSEMVDGEYIHHATVQRDIRVVTEMEEKYIFFAKQASVAKKQVKFGRSCVFSVYRREP